MIVDCHLNRQWQYTHLLTISFFELWVVRYFLHRYNPTQKLGITNTIPMLIVQFWRLDGLHADDRLIHTINSRPISIIILELLFFRLITDKT